jgi:hypothetical protein
MLYLPRRHLLPVVSQNRLAGLRVLPQDLQQLRDVAHHGNVVRHRVVIRLRLPRQLGSQFQKPFEPNAMGAHTLLAGVAERQLKAVEVRRDRRIQNIQ